LTEPVAGIPGELEDRAEDAWEPLLAVANVAGGEWPQRARIAAVQITREAATDDDDQSLETRLLADVKAVFADQAHVTFLASNDLLAELRKLEESPWGDWDLTARKLAIRLAKFGVKPKHNTAKTSRGYHLHDLADPFGRYLPSNPSNPSNSPFDLHERPDGLEPPDGLTRPARTTRPEETAGQYWNGTGRTGRGDECPSCSESVADPPRPDCDAADLHHEGRLIA